MSKRPKHSNAINVQVSGDGHVSLTPQLDDMTAVSIRGKFNVGQKMKDGTFYLGRFIDENGVKRDWYAADNQGQSISLHFNEAAAFATNSVAHGHHDWVLPPSAADQENRPDILGVMFRNKAAIGVFKEAGNFSEVSYWSSTGDEHLWMRTQSFKDGGVSPLWVSGDQASVRLVRSEVINPVTSKIGQKAREIAARLWPYQKYTFKR